MPEMDGIELVQNVKKTYPQIKILALTMHNEPELIKAIIKAGADGYLLKNVGKEELLKAIKLLYEGKFF